MPLMSVGMILVYIEVIDYNGYKHVLFKGRKRSCFILLLIKTIAGASG